VSRKSNLSQVLKIMEEGGVRFEIEGRTIVVF
jgi:predicted nucleotidyltransferase